MPDQIDIRIQSTFSGAGVTQATAASKQLLAAQQQLTQAQAAATAAGKSSTSATEQAAAAVAKAERAVLSEATALAGLQRAQGNAAGGAQTLAGALAQVDQSSVAAVRAQTQLATMEARVASEAQRAAVAEREAAAAAAQMTTAANTTGLAQMPGQLNSIVGGAQKVALAFGAIGGAMMALHGVTDLASLGAKANDAKDSFNNLAKAAGSSGSELLSKMHAAASGTVSDTNLMISANTGLLLAGDKIATALPRLLEIARASAKATGQDVGFLFDSLVRGISRGSPKIIDNAGITLDAAAAMDTYAASIGKTANELTNQEQQQATLNAVLTTGATFIDKIGLSADTDAVRMQQATVAVDEFKTALGQRLLPVVGTVATGLKNLLSEGDMFAGAKGGADQAQATIVAQATSYEAYSQKIIAVNQQLHDELTKSDPLFASLAGGLQALTPAQLAYAQSLIATGTAEGEAVAKAQALQSVADNLQRSFFNVGAGAELSATQQAAMGAQMLAIASTGEAGVVAVDDLTFAFQNHQITAAGLQTGLTALTTEQENHAAAAADDASMMAQVTPAVQAATVAVDDHARALMEAATQADIARAQGDLLTQTQDNLYAAAQAAVAGSDNLSNAASRLAAQFNLPIGKARELIGLLAQIGQQSHIKFVTENRDDLKGSRDNAAAARPLSTEFLADQKKRTDELRQAQIGLANAQGQTAKSTALMRQEQGQYVKGSADWLKIETQIIGANKAKGGGGGRGGSAADKEAKAAEKTGDSLANIERNTGQKLAEIDQTTQQKLLDIDQKYAAQREAAARQLANDITTSSDDMKVAQESDDLDLVGAKGDALKKLQAREAAEGKARIANEKAVSEAKATIAAGGDAKLAGDQLKIKQDTIKQQEALDQHYAERQAELSGDKKSLSALKTQYDEATAAIQQASDDRLSIAQAAGDQAAAAEDEEKAKVIAAAQDQKEKVVATAIEQADKVKGASAAQKAAVIEGLSAQAMAAGQWAADTEAASGRVIAAYNAAARAAGGSVPGGASGGGGGTGQTHAAGGLTGVTHGPTTLTVGDNPGGMELVSVIPLSGRGTTSIGGSMARMAGGGSLLAGGGNTGGATGATGMDSIIWQILNGSHNQKAQISALKQYLAVVEQAATIITTISQIRSTLAAPQPLLRVEDMLRIATDAAMVTTILADNIVPATRLQANQLVGYTQMIKISVESLQAITALRKDAAEAKSPLNEKLIRQLALEVQMVTAILMETLIPTGRQAHDALEYYADVSSKGVSILKNMVDLRASMAGLKGPLDERVIRNLAVEAQRVARIVLSILVPVSEQLAADMGHYADAMNHSVGILKDTLDLRGAVATMGSPITDADIRRLANEAIHITRIMRGMLIPTTEAQGKAAGAYADAVDKSVSAINSALGLSGKMFTDYTSPSDAQIRMVVADANRVVRSIAAAAKTYDTKGLEAAKLFNEAASGTFGVVKDGLVAAQALNSGDFTLNPAKLAQFEAATAKTLAVTKRLGALARTIPAADIAALGATTTALSAQAEALIRLSAVPWGDLPAALAGLQQQGGALVGGAVRGGSTTINVNVYNPPANLNVPALIQQVQAGINRGIQARH